MTTKTDKQVLDELNKVLIHLGYERDGTGPLPIEKDVTDFFLTLRKSDRETLIKEIEKRQAIWTSVSARRALSDIISLIKR